MTPVPAVWNFNLSACLRLDIWNASLECFIAQAICFTNLKYCDDGLNGDYNLYVGGSRVSFAFLGKCLAASKMQTFRGSLEQLTPRGPWSWVYLPAGKYHRWWPFGSSFTLLYIGSSTETEMSSGKHHVREEGLVYLLVGWGVLLRPFLINCSLDPRPWTRGQNQNLSGRQHVSPVINRRRVGILRIKRGFYFKQSRLQDNQRPVKF